jgi:hypothetical protein
MGLGVGNCIFSRIGQAFTVKLGYNDHGYNELTVIANRFHLLVWFSIIFQ